MFSRKCDSCFLTITCLLLIKIYVLMGMREKWRDMAFLKSSFHKIQQHISQLLLVMLEISKEFHCVTIFTTFYNIYNIYYIIYICIYIMYIYNVHMFLGWPNLCKIDTLSVFLHVTPCWAAFPYSTLQSSFKIFPITVYLYSICV